MEVQVRRNKWMPIYLDMFHTVVFFSLRDESADPSSVVKMLSDSQIHLTRPTEDLGPLDAVSENSVGFCKYIWLRSDESSRFYHAFLISASLKAVHSADVLAGVVAHEVAHVIQRLNQRQSLDGEESTAYVAEYLLATILRDHTDLDGVFLSTRDDS